MAAASLALTPAPTLGPPTATRVPPTATPELAPRCLTTDQSSRFVQTSGLSDVTRIDANVRNKCAEPVNAAVRLAKLRKASEPDGPDIDGFDRWEIRLGTIPPNGTVSFQMPVTPKVSGGTSYTWDYTFRTLPSGTPGYGLPCWNEGASKCLNADLQLGYGGALYQLAQIPSGQGLLKAAADNGVVVRVDHLPPGVLGTYAPAIRTATIDDRMLTYGAREQAAVIAHELQHAADDAAGKLREAKGIACFENEETACHAEAEVWNALNGGRLPTPRTSIQTELNELTRKALNDPYALLGSLGEAYGHQCT